MIEPPDTGDTARDHAPITYSQMRLAEKDRLLAFLKTAYADTPRHSDPVFWDWHFLAHPYSEPDNIPVWLAKSGERIVGQLATIPVELNTGRETARAIWILDLIVDPEFRRRGIMKRLVVEAEKSYPFMLGAATDAQHSPAMLRGMGWAILTKIPRYHKILFPGNALKEIAGIRPVRSAVNIAFAPFRRGLGSPSKTKGTIELVEEFDSSFNELWNQARGQWNCSLSRSSEMLDWQFRRQPGKKFDVLGYYESGVLRGFAVLFFRKANEHGAIMKAAISDICYHPEKPAEIVDALLQGSLELAVKRRAGGLVTDALDPLLEERLRHFGFWKVKSGLLLMANGPRNRETLYDPSKWFLTRGDSDISIFEDANL